MPGMDGLQAVQAIKSNPQTAMIPDHDVHLAGGRAVRRAGARARRHGRAAEAGAAGRRVEGAVRVASVAGSARLAEPALVPVEVGDGCDRPERAGGGPRRLPLPPDWGRRIEAAVKQQSVDLRRFIVASLDSFAARFEADLRRAVPTPPAAPAPRTRRGRTAALGDLALGARGGRPVPARRTVRAAVDRRRATISPVRARNSRRSSPRNADLKQSNDRLAATVKDLAAAVTANTCGRPRRCRRAPGGGGLPRSEPVPYGELPFDRSRLEVLRDVLSEARGAELSRCAESDQLARLVLLERQCRGWIHAGCGDAARQQMRHGRKSLRGIPDGPAAPIHCVRESRGRRASADGEARSPWCSRPPRRRMPPCRIRRAMIR